MILKYQEGLNKQKNVGRVGVLNATLGRYRENTGFLITILKFFFSKLRVQYRAKLYEAGFWPNVWSFEQCI